jgi:hypothetical protein
LAARDGLREEGHHAARDQAELAARGVVVKALSTIADMLHRLDQLHKKVAESFRAGPS